MDKLRKVLHPVKKEFRKEKCGFDHKPADDFVKSQWQSCSKSVAYLIYRWFMALFFIAVVIESMIASDDSTNFWLYFIYMTNWGIILCMLTNLYGAILVTIWHYHPECADKLLNMEQLTCPFRIYWGMHIITLVVSIVITIVYWSILFKTETCGLCLTTILTHAFNSIFMFIDLLIIAHPLRLLHIFLPVLFGLVYAFFTIIFHLCGGHNKKGKPYIYRVIDWHQPESACGTILAIIVLACCVYFILFVIYKLRILLYRRVKNNALFLPTTTTKTATTKNATNNAKDTHVTGIKHSSSSISMVLGNYNTGYPNPSFTGSTDNITN